MRQNIGGLAGLLAVIGLLMHTQSPPSGERPAGRGAAPPVTKGKSTPEPEPEDGAEGPWVATRAFFPGATGIAPVPPG